MSVDVFPASKNTQSRKNKDVERSQSVSISSSDAGEDRRGSRNPSANVSGAVSASLAKDELGSGTSTTRSNAKDAIDDIYQTLPRKNMSSRGEQLQHVLQLATKLCRSMPYVVDEVISVRNKGFVNKVRSMWQGLKIEISKLDDDHKAIAFQKMQAETQDVILALGKRDRRLDKDFLRPWVKGNRSLYTEVECEERNMLFMNDPRINELFEMIWKRVEVGID